MSDSSEIHLPLKYLHGVVLIIAIKKWGFPRTKKCLMFQARLVRMHPVREFVLAKSSLSTSESTTVPSNTVSWHGFKTNSGYFYLTLFTNNVAITANCTYHSILHVRIVLAVTSQHAPSCQHGCRFVQRDWKLLILDQLQFSEFLSAPLLVFSDTGSI